MGWLPPSPDSIAVCQCRGSVRHAARGRRMKNTMIGVDLAKTVFHVHGVSMTGHVKFRKKLRREQFRRFMADQPSCVVVLEACGSASYGRGRWKSSAMKRGSSRAVRAPLCQAPEERCRRRRGDRDRRAASRDAVRRAEVRRAAGAGRALPCPRAPRSRTHNA